MNRFLKLSPLLILLVYLSACNLNTVPCDPLEPAEPEPLPNIARDSRLMSERLWGAFVPGAAYRPEEMLLPLERSLGGEFDIIHWFSDWDAEFEARPFENVRALGRAPLLTWQSENRSLEAIQAGAFDAYLREWARGLEAFGSEVYVRIFPEMNAKAKANELWHGRPNEMVAAWRHVVQVFRDEGATNVKWVWSPNVTDEPRTPENRMELYYPGDAYVDIAGLDGYNWGGVKPDPGWQYFETIFADAYARVSDLSDKAIWIAETASAERCGDKAVWVEDMLSSNAFPRVEAVVWFHQKKEARWKMNSSTASLRVFQTLFAARSANIFRAEVK